MAEEEAAAAAAVVEAVAAAASAAVEKIGTRKFWFPEADEGTDVLYCTQGKIRLSIFPPFYPHPHFYGFSVA